MNLDKGKKRKKKEKREKILNSNLNCPPSFIIINPIYMQTSQKKKKFEMLLPHSHAYFCKVTKQYDKFYH